MRETEEFWDELFAQIEAGQAIPVVGQELLTVVEGGREISLYQAFAERLLAKYGLVGRLGTPPAELNPGGAIVPLRPHRELNDAVCDLPPTREAHPGASLACGPSTRQLWRRLAASRATSADGRPTRLTIQLCRWSVTGRRRADS